jgi:predicted phosphodiesterase
MKNIWTLFTCILFSMNWAWAQNTFIAAPYLQIGYDASPTNLSLLWHTADTTSNWSVQVKTKNNWVESKNIYFNQVNVKGYNAFAVYHSTLNKLEAGVDFTYRVLKNKQVVFESMAHAPKAKNQDYNFVVIGDIGALTKNQKKLANIMYDLNPDFVAVPGDIVYNSGLIKDYTTKFWPIYNAEKNDSSGAPLMRKIPFFASVGNHDANDRDMDKTPDALSYYYFWEQPLNGPNYKEGSALVPILKGSEANRNAFYTAAGKAYPNMTTYSYDYGNAHWTVIDADYYVDWTDKDLQNWVAQDLKKAANAQWRFILFHQPGFNSSKVHFEEQHMRLLSPIFEAGKVDVVFNGHVHNYQRSFPLTFKPNISTKKNRSILIDGDWILDKKFDGVANQKPNGVIYIVTGAGGQDLYNPEQTNAPATWQSFTDKFFSTDNSLSFVEIVKNKFTFKQIASSGKVVDSFTITK